MSWTWRLEESDSLSAVAEVVSAMSADNNAVLSQLKHCHNLLSLTKPTPWSNKNNTLFISAITLSTAIYTIGHLQPKCWEGNGSMWERCGHPHNWAISAAHCRLRAMYTEMSTDPNVPELWERCWLWVPLPLLLLLFCVNQAINSAAAGGAGVSLMPAAAATGILPAMMSAVKRPAFVDNKTGLPVYQPLPTAATAASMPYHQLSATPLQLPARYISLPGRYCSMSVCLSVCLADIWTRVVPQISYKTALSCYFSKCEKSEIFVLQGIYFWIPAVSYVMMTSRWHH